MFNEIVFPYHGLHDMSYNYDLKSSNQAHNSSTLLLALCIKPQPTKKTHNASHIDITNDYTLIK